MLCSAVCCVPAIADDLEFFEAKIRPVLIEHCYACHNATGTREAGLAVDSREGLLRGGSGGPAVVPGRPDQSRLLAVIRHAIDGVEMPQGGGKLSEAVIADVTTWIQKGAIDPRSDPSGQAHTQPPADAWPSTFRDRQQWWSFQPVVEGGLPAWPDDAAIDGRFQRHPIDRFMAQGWAQRGLTPVQRASPEVLLRRLSFALVGLPPSPKQIRTWLPRLSVEAEPQRDRAYRAFVDTLLESPRFGERWGRHWMDWVRYAESHGSEGDPRIVGAHLYRDYLIRAFNQDISLRQLILEHLAGDQLPQPPAQP